MSAIFFNLLVNSAFSMACGMLIVGLAVWFFRVESGSWKLFLLSLPFVKVVYDSLRGLPADTVLLSGLDPFLLPPKHQLLKIGAGMSYWGPKLNLVFGVQDTSGQEYAASVGDYLVIWLNRTFGTQVPLTILTGVLSISLYLLTKRILAAVRFETGRKRDRIKSQLLETLRLRFRRVEIYCSKAFSGTPFTGGVFRPYICIPRNSLEKLNPQELEAVIAHEMAHIRKFDLVTTFSIQLLGDLFWFVPGFRWLSRKIDSLREVVADHLAVQSGIDPTILASALVKLKEVPTTGPRLVLYSALFRSKSLLKLRIERLLGSSSEKPSRFGWSNVWFRLLITFWIFTAVMIATLGGNHPTSGL